MGGNIPGQIIGTAPLASYWLLRSEDGGSEYIIEEYNWVSAAEFADSVGADVINSSLGYYEFDDPSTDHTYDDMDGNTTPVTIGADVAASRGIIVCNSAGNEGADPWHYIIAPSDGDSVVCVGGVDSFGNYAFFSSVGPSSDGRIKPDVAAQGQDAWIAYAGGGFGGGNGTSFASPITAGMMACLWQANQDKTNMEIILSVQKSGDQYANPDELLGYGIPDYMAANSILTIIESPAEELSAIGKVYPNPFSSAVNLALDVDYSGIIQVQVIDLTGRILKQEELMVNNNSVINLNDLSELPGGIYTMRVLMDNQAYTQKLVKM
jgi:subtilisin family serine protease